MSVYSEIDYTSLQIINKNARYRNNVSTVDAYIHETLIIQNKIGSLNHKIGILKNEVFELEIEYKKQQINDFINIINVFGQAAYNAYQQSYDMPSLGFSLLLNLNPETVAETISDYSNSPRITSTDVKQLKLKNKKEIKKEKSEMRGLEAELKSYESEIIRMKEEMNGNREYWKK